MGQTLTTIKNCVSCNILNFSCHSDCCKEDGCFNCDYNKNSKDTETDLKICSLSYRNRSTVHTTNI